MPIPGAHQWRFPTELHDASKGQTLWKWKVKVKLSFCDDSTADDSLFVVRCSIDFMNSPALNCNQDIIFHIGIRSHEGVIVRNHFQHGNWGPEERYGHCRVKSNGAFEVFILAEHQHYKIAVNGHHLGVFRHRIPLSLVNYVNVSGDVSIDHVLLEQDLRSVHDQSIVSHLVATPAAPRMPINIPVQMHVHTPMQTTYHPPPPPPYNMQQPHYMQQPHTVK